MSSPDAAVSRIVSRNMTTRAQEEPNYWIGVASYDHVKAAVEGGFCQLGHGKAAPVRLLRRGDVLVFYSPREALNAGAAVQAFTAIGRVTDDEPLSVEQSTFFRPFRREIRYVQSRPAPIHPLLPKLSFTRDRTHWGIAFRRACFSISPVDYREIARAMGAPD
jgi:hypothetical protein